MKNMKVEITHENSKIWLRFTTSEFSRTGFTDYTDGLWKIINASKWHIKESKYIYSGKGKSLHRTVMEYWYGQEWCEKMSKKGFVIDHIDNDGFNCLYENLEFLTHVKNWHYKGNYYDKERIEKLPIAAINIFKKKDGDKFQITIGFNTPFSNAQGEVISKAFFVYETKDYDLVLADALSLVESVGKGQIAIHRLRYNRLKWEPPYHYINSDGIPLKGGNVVNVNGEWFIVRGDEFQIVKIAPDDTLW
jgi:hypothetical protein